jgi:hypothetical protein
VRVSELVAWLSLGVAVLGVIPWLWVTVRYWRARCKSAEARNINGGP